MALSACAPQRIETRQAGFVDAAAVVPALLVEMRYAGSDNFVGRPIDGYEAPVCLLTHEAAAALAEVQRALATDGLGLKVFDCYRPARAVADFAAWARDLDVQTTKAEYYPNVDKDQLFALGYSAERSGHSRGSTLDVTLIDLASGRTRHGHGVRFVRSVVVANQRWRVGRGARQPDAASSGDDRARLPPAARGVVAFYDGG
jgi:D-alanyl-D-alanine dipeptidase